MNEATVDDLERRKSALNEFISEGRTALVNFLKMAGLPNPSHALVDAEPFIRPISDWLANEDFSGLGNEDLLWLTTQVANISGQYFITKQSRTMAR